MKNYIKAILQPDLNGEPGLLIFDKYKSHYEDSVNVLLEESNVSTIIIPGGYTCVLQPLDVSINGPMKDKFKENWANWMAEETGPKDFTPSKLLNYSYSKVELFRNYYLLATGR